MPDVIEISDQEAHKSSGGSSQPAAEPTTLAFKPEPESITECQVTALLRSNISTAVYLSSSADSPTSTTVHGVCDYYAPSISATAQGVNGKFVADRRTRCHEGNLVQRFAGTRTIQTTPFSITADPGLLRIYLGWHTSLFRYFIF